MRSSSGQEPAARRVGVRRDVCICWAFTRCVTVGKTGPCDFGWDTHLGGSKPVIFHSTERERVCAARTGMSFSEMQCTSSGSGLSQQNVLLHCQRTFSHPALLPTHGQDGSCIKFFLRYCLDCILICRLQFQTKPKQAEDMNLPLMEG